MNAPGEIINNTFSGAASVDIGLGEGVPASPATLSSLLADGYFFGNGAYDPTAIQGNNFSRSRARFFILRNGVPQDGVYTRPYDCWA